MIRRSRLAFLRQDIDRQVEFLCIGVARRLPKRVRYWVTVLSMAGDAHGRAYDYPGDRTSAEVLRGIESWNRR